MIYRRSLRPVSGRAAGLFVCALVAIAGSLEAAPTDIAEIAIESRVATTLRGPDSRYQLVVTGTPAAGDPRDVTSAVRIELAPAGIAHVDEFGLVTPITEGAVKLIAHLQGAEGRELVSEVDLEVRDIENERPIHFPNEIVPVFTKLGCNGGGCHGKSGGQNGFRLSLLGFYPEEDFEYLTKEGRGRRVSVAAPERSLLLLKASNEVPHGGGARAPVGSHEYRLLRRWMQQGMPYGSGDDPRVESIAVVPNLRRLERNTSQQLSVVARYTDGHFEDVTHVAQFESRETELAEVSPTGLVSTGTLAGEAAVMVRYQGQVDVFRAIVPLGVEVTDLPEPRNFVDELAFAKWRDLGIPPSPACDDVKFLRRVTVDIAGRLPTVAEVEAFAADESTGKRDALVERLLASPEYAEYFANKWSAVLRNRRANDNYARGTVSFYDWLRESLHQGRGFDAIARDIIASTGDVRDNPPVGWYRAVTTTEQRAEDSAQLFLGLRIQCARCHHHPFERWSQRDYSSYAAFFSQVGHKDNPEGRAEERRLVHQPGKATGKDPRSGETLLPAGLGAVPVEVEAEEDPRLALADWMADPGNPFFARALVNRYWKHFFSRGFVEPEDDMRVTNPPSHPELLDALAAHFVESGFDLKELVRTICRSRTYQLSSLPNEHNALDRQGFSRYYPKRLNAEVLYDALHTLTGTKTSFAGLPPGTRAVEIPDSSANNYFLTVFGRPMAESSCECERSNDASLAQSLHLINSKEILDKIAAGDGRAARLANDAARPAAERVVELYRAAFARMPDAEELAIAVGHVEGSSDPKAAWEDLVWALLNTKEFLFNH